MSVDLDELQGLIDRLRTSGFPYQSIKRDAADALTALRDEVIALRQALALTTDNLEWFMRRYGATKSDYLAVESARVALQSTAAGNSHE